MEADEKYAELEVDGGLVIYYRQNHEAWVQSDAHIALDEML